MTDALAAAQAKVIVNSTFFFEPQIDPGLVYINKLLDLYAKNVPQTQPDAAALPPGVAPPVPDTQAATPDIVQFGALLREAEQALNTDRKLAERSAARAMSCFPWCSRPSLSRTVIPTSRCPIT